VHTFTPILFCTLPSNFYVFRFVSHTISIFYTYSEGFRNFYSEKYEKILLVFLVFIIKPFAQNQVCNYFKFTFSFWFRLCSFSVFIRIFVTLGIRTLSGPSIYTGQSFLCNKNTIGPGIEPLRHITFKAHSIRNICSWNLFGTFHVIYFNTLLPRW